MAKIWLISDTHFAHANMYKFLRADGTRVRHRFASAKEGDEYMVERWNALVKPEHHIYHLGDVAMAPIGYKLLAKCQGHKRVVLGNHDNSDMKHLREAGVQKIFGMRHLAGLWLTHAPLYIDLKFFGKFLGNVHGHIHEKASPTLAHFNVCVEWTNYEPVELDYVVAKFESRKRNGYV